MSTSALVAIVLGALTVPAVGRAVHLGPVRQVPAVAPATAPTRRSGPSIALGRRIRGIARAAPDRRLDEMTGRAVVLAVAFAPVSLPLAAIVVLVAAIRPVFVRRARARAHATAVMRELPELIDLYSIALRNGHNVATATQHVVRWGQGTVVQSLADCLEQVGRGRPLVDAIEELPERLGEIVRPLARILIASERDGAPIGDPLRVLAADIRRRRRRDAETRARRVPVAMLFPLVVFILPAFMMLTVVPTTSRRSRRSRADCARFPRTATPPRKHHDHLTSARAGPDHGRIRAGPAGGRHDCHARRRLGGDRRHRRLLRQRDGQDHVADRVKP